MIKLISIIVISVLGTCLHFTYDLSNHNKVFAYFSAVNESVWEHIKIGLTASFVWSLIDGLIFGNNGNYFFAKMISFLTLTILIPVLFYGYKLITKKAVLVVDIIIFYIAIIVSQLLFFELLNLKSVLFLVNYFSIIIIFVLFTFYITLTISPIKNDLLKDPTNGKYGIKAHKH